MKGLSTKIAVIDGITGSIYSYSELVYRVHCIASAITTRGLKKGDKVGMLAHNSVDYLSVYLATIGCGGTIVALNPSYTKYELDPLLAMTRPKFLFANTKPFNNLLSSINATSIERIFIMDSDSMPGTSSVDRLLEEGHSQSPINDESNKNADDLALISFSSGTTGGAKGVPITSTNLIASSNILEYASVATENSVLISVLPMYHMYGIMVSLLLTTVSKSTCVILPSFHSTTFLRSIEKYRINHLHLVPPMLLFLLNHSDLDNYDLSSVLKISTAAASVGREVETRINNLFRKKNPQFVFGQGYGLSEAAGYVTLRPHTQEISTKKMGSVGLLMPNTDMKIVSTETEEEVGPNISGEMLIRGPSIITGYYNMEGSLRSVYFDEDWLRTGDLGYYDEDQYIYICDRIKELIKVKGHQVAPAEIESLLLTHPNIQDCAVVGVAHDVYGEVPRAFVVKKEEVNEGDILRLVEENLTSYKHLRGGVEFVESIPKSPSGKVLRRLLIKK